MSVINVVNINPIKARLFKLAKSQFEDAVARVEPIIEKHVCRAAISFGKDSTLMAMVTIEAYRRVMSRIGNDNMPGPLLISHGDTGIENPVMKLYARRQLKKLKAYLSELGVPHEVYVSTPPDRYSWPVMYVGGLKLPTTHLSKYRDCSAILKRDPAVAVEKKLAAIYGKVVTILGSRNEESSSRKQSNEKHGIHTGELSSLERPDGSVALAIAPIVHMTTDEVWGAIRTFGKFAARTYGDHLPYWDNSSWMLERIYDSASDQCQLHDYGIDGMQKGGCDARTGCSLCAVVPSDKSAQAMLREPQNAFMGNLLLIRNFVVNHFSDMSYRRFMARKPDDHGYVALHPNCHNELWLTQMLRWMLQADRDEQRRAMQFRAKIKNGTPEWDVGYKHILEMEGLEDWQREEWLQNYIEDMSEPTFQLVSETQLLLIEAFWSRDALNLPHYTAIKIWDDIHNKRLKVPYPEEHEVNPIVDPVPETRYVYVGHDEYSDNIFNGLAHAVFDNNCVTKKVKKTQEFYIAPLPTYNTDEIKPLNWYLDNASSEKTEEFLAMAKGKPMVFHLPTTDYQTVLDIVETEDGDDSGYMIDPDTADFMLNYMTDDYVKKYHDTDSILRRNACFYHFLTMGVLRLSPGSIRSCSKLLMRAAMYEQAGLHHIGPTASKEVQEKSISHEEYEARIRKIHLANLEARRKEIDTYYARVMEYRATPAKAELAFLKETLTDLKTFMRHSIFNIVGSGSCIEDLSDGVDYHNEGISMRETHSTYTKSLSYWSQKLGTQKGLLSLLPASSYLRQLDAEGAVPHKIRKTLDATIWALKGYINEYWIEALYAFIKLCDGEEWVIPEMGIRYKLYDREKQKADALRKIHRIKRLQTTKTVKAA